MISLTGNGLELCAVKTGCDDFCVVSARYRAGPNIRWTALNPRSIVWTQLSRHFVASFVAATLLQCCCNGDLEKSDLLNGWEFFDAVWGIDGTNKAKHSAAFWCAPIGYLRKPEDLSS